MAKLWEMKYPLKELRGGGGSGADHAPGKFHKYLNLEPNVTFLIRQTQYLRTSYEWTIFFTKCSKCIVRNPKVLVVLGGFVFCWLKSRKKPLIVIQRCGSSNCVTNWILTTDIWLLFRSIAVKLGKLRKHDYLFVCNILGVGYSNCAFLY